MTTNNNSFVKLSEMILSAIPKSKMDKKPIHLGKIISVWYNPSYMNEMKFKTASIGMNKVNNLPIILVDDYFMNLLEQGYYNLAKFIILHELGHYYLGHLNKEFKDKNPNINTENDANEFAERCSGLCTKQMIRLEARLSNRYAMSK